MSIVKHGVSIAAVVITAGIAAGCGGAGAVNNDAGPAGGAKGGSGGGTGDTLVVARDMDINSLDPGRGYCETCQIYMSTVYQTVVGLDVDNKTLVPRLAKTWTASPDAKTYTFRLDPQARFSDGSPVTAADVKFSWLRLARIGSPSSYLAAGIARIATPDEHTVKVTLSSPNAEFLNIASSAYMGIINSAVAKTHGATDATTAAKADTAEKWFLSHSAGSGPYVLDSYKEGDQLVFARNPKYWATAPAFSRIVMREVKDAVAQAQLLKSGSADLAMQIDPTAAKNAQGDGITLKTIPSFNFVWLGLGPAIAANTDARLNDDLRLAIRNAIDYKGLIAAVLPGAARPMGAPIPLDFDGGAGLPVATQDLAKAKQLLAAGGHPNGFTLTAVYADENLYGVDLTTAMQFVQSNLAKVGIKLKLKPVPFSVFLDQSNKGQVPITILGWAPDYRGSGQYVNVFGLIPKSLLGASAGGAVNKTELADYQRALGTSDEAQRVQLFNQVGRQMIADNVAIPLMSPDLVLAYRSDLRNVSYSACCNTELWRIGRSA